MFNIVKTETCECGCDKFFSNETQVRCAKCGRFHCRKEDYKGRLLTGEQVNIIQMGGTIDSGLLGII